MRNSRGVRASDDDYYDAEYDSYYSDDYNSEDYDSEYSESQRYTGDEEYEHFV